MKNLLSRLGSKKSWRAGAGLGGGSRKGVVLAGALAMGALALGAVWAAKAPKAAPSPLVKYGCAVCHQAAATSIAPTLKGLYGNKVKLQSGEIVTADDAYIRESILKPRAKIVKGYQPVMPVFEGKLTEEQITELIQYIKSIGPKKQ